MTRHHEWLGRHARLINESKEEFVRHNKTKYGLPLIIWVACEVWDFGTMSRLYAGMREAEQDAISAKYGVHNGRTFATWLRSLNYLLLRIARHLLQVVNPSSSWPERVKAHLETFPDLDHLSLNLAGMGAPDGWEHDW